MMPNLADGAEDPRVATIAAELGLRDATVTPLSGGLLNRNLRLRDASHDLALRLAGRGADALGVDREAELAMQRMAAQAGLAPAVVLARPAEGLLVTRYVAGRALAYEDARQSAMLVRIGAWLARLHALPPPRGLASIDIAVRAAGYLQTLRETGRTPLQRELEQRLTTMRDSLPSPRRLAACHHDLHHLNLVDQGDTLIALDWEYAGPGDPAVDLAACICYHDLDRERIEPLLAGYGGDSQQLFVRLVPLCWIFDCLWYGWLQIAETQGIAADSVRSRRLIDRLMA